MDLVEGLNIAKAICRDVTDFYKNGLCVLLSSPMVKMILLEVEAT